MSVAVVTGSRSIVLTAALIYQFWSTLEWLRLREGIDTVRHGACPHPSDRRFVSVDMWIDEHVRATGLYNVERWHAPWDRYGRAAGPIRNRAMLTGFADAPEPAWVREPAKVLIGFPGGVGTNGCIAIADELRTPVVRLGAR